MDNDFGRALEKAALENANSQMQERARRKRCRIHGKQAKLTPKGQTLQNLSWEVEACCEEFAAEIRRSF
jgi:hypothetical protein